MAKLKNKTTLLIEAARNQLLEKVLILGNLHLSDLASNICYDILIEEKTFIELGKERMLTQSRIKQIFESSVMRQVKLLESINSKALGFDELNEKYISLLEKYSVIIENRNKTESLQNTIEQFPDAVTKILNTRVRNTNLSGRAKGVSQGAGFVFVSDMVKVNPDYLLKLRNCGKGTIKDFEDFFTEHNLSWNML